LSHTSVIFKFKAWNAEYVDEQIFLCGGANINQVISDMLLTILISQTNIVVRLPIVGP